MNHDVTKGLHAVTVSQVINFSTELKLTVVGGGEVKRGITNQDHKASELLAIVNKSRSMCFSGLMFVEW